MDVFIQQLDHSFKNEVALSGINLSIASNKITGLVGPDGAGKTTLLRMLTGLLKPTRGSILIDQLDPIQNLEALRPQIAYMPQKFGLYEDLSVLENLTLYADLNNITGEVRQKRFKQLLNFTDLTRFGDRLAGKLSGGMKQKLGLACVLIGSPKLLLLDEPSVGVDPISRRELWKMVTALAEDGMTVIWSTAYLDEAERCDDVILMNAGHVLYQGSPESLFSRMAGRSYLLVEPHKGFEKKRQILQLMLNQPEVIDGVIQGRDIRLVLKEAGQLPDLNRVRHFEKDALFIPTTARLEDGFMDLLGGGPRGESVLAQHIKAKHVATSEVEKALRLDQALRVVIEAKMLTKKFGSFTATNNISFAVKRGEIFGLLGPNGAGKSTTFKMMCGLLVPTSGDAQVMGIDLKKSAALARQKLGYMSQKFALYGQLSVQQNLMFFAGIYGLFGKDRQQQVSQMIDIFALKPYLNTDAGTLPLGFKQRLALACAMMHSPEILFLDEPTSGVDPITRREFWSHINALVDVGITVMVTTHFMDEAEYCDRIGLVYRGKLIACDTPDGLKASVVSKENRNPSMEDAFIELVTRYDSETI